MRKPGDTRMANDESMSSQLASPLFMHMFKPPPTVSSPPVRWTLRLVHWALASKAVARTRTRVANATMFLISSSHDGFQNPAMIP
jgi:hypothetical protein